MAERVHLTGHYRVLDEAFLREKANRKNDPRHVFYAAMLANKTYQAYLDEIGQRKVTVNGFKDGPIKGRREILYARQHGWIADG